MQKSARKPTLKWETHTILWVLEYLLKCKIIRVEYMEKIILLSHKACGPAIFFKQDMHSTSFTCKYISIWGGLCYKPEVVSWGLLAKTNLAVNLHCSEGRQIMMMMMMMISGIFSVVYHHTSYFGMSGRSRSAKDLFQLRSGLWNIFKYIIIPYHNLHSLVPNCLIAKRMVSKIITG